MNIKLIIIDEINCKFVGLLKKDIMDVISQTEVSVKGAYMTAPFKLGIWNGKESQFSKTGEAFVFMLPDIVPMITKKGYNIELVDNRKKIIQDDNEVDFEFLNEYGTQLRPYQIESINHVIKKRQGVVDIATSGGKSKISAGIAKYYDHLYRTIIIVPKENLAQAAKKEFECVGLDVGHVSSKVKDKEAQWNKRHVVVTWQTLRNHKQHLKNFDIVLYDETHIMSNVMFGILSNELSQAHIRIGFTGTVPSDKHKRQKIFCHIGGGVIHKVDSKELQDDGYISTLDITMIPVKHEIVLPDKEWSTEYAYINKNKKRVDIISKFISQLEPEYTLILCYPQFGSQLAKCLNIDFIDKDVVPMIRVEFYDKFNTVGNYTLVASYETVGTGISINNIKRLITIDSGKNETRVLQSIGRGLRLDGDTNHLRVLDMFSQLIKIDKHNNKFVYNYGGIKHFTNRKKIYRDNCYPFIETNGISV